MEVEFRAIRRNAVAQEAIDTIKHMIVRGELQAGQRLPPERDLAGQLRVSRPSLREAIRALIALNILESRHGDGTYVSSLEPELLAEPIDFVLQVNASAIFALFEARRVLEAGVAALAAERASDLELAQLEDFVKRGRGKLSDPEAFIEHDVEFHDRIRRAARSPVLSSLLASVSGLSYESRRRTAQSSAVRAKALADHQSMVRTLKARDPEAAREAMVEHLRHVLEGLSAEAPKSAPLRSVRADYCARYPPSTARTWPVTMLEAAEARKSAGPTISEARPNRRIGVKSSRRS
jgi:GntR family transcriptional regulator, transcriptional repressor for pyruvate dehydrogenase complex